MYPLLRELQSVVLPWRLRKTLETTPLCPPIRLYLLLVLPLAGITPIVQILFNVAFLFLGGSAFFSFSGLLYVALQHVAFGMISTFVVARLILFFTRYVGASQDMLRAHHLAAIAITPTFVAMPMRSLLSNTLAIELLAVLYGGCLLVTGLPIMPGGSRRRWAYYVVLIVANILALSNFDEAAMGYLRLVLAI